MLLGLHAGLAYVEPDNLCIAPNAFMAFHSIRSMEHGERSWWVPMDIDPCVFAYLVHVALTPVERGRTT